MSARDGLRRRGRRRLGFPLRRRRRERGGVGEGNRAGENLLWDGGISEGKNTLLHRRFFGRWPWKKESARRIGRVSTALVVSFVPSIDGRGWGGEGGRQRTIEWPRSSFPSEEGRDATRKSIFLKGGVGKRGRRGRGTREKFFECVQGCTKSFFASSGSCLRDAQELRWQLRWRSHESHPT